MTDFADDELLSAYLDGEATPEEVARVEADAALIAEAARLEALRHRLDVADPPSELAAAHITAAMAEYDQRDGEASGGGGAPVPAADLRARRASLLQRIPLGAVAAVVIVLALVGAATQLDFESDDDAATATAESADDSDAGDATTSAETNDDGAGGDAATEGQTFDTDIADEEANQAASAPDAAAGRGVLAFSDVDGLAEFVASNYDDFSGDGFTSQLDTTPESTTTSATDTASSSTAPCDPVITAGVEADQVTVVLPVVIAGDQVTAVVSEDGGGSRRLMVVSGDGCTILADREL